MSCFYCLSLWVSALFAIWIGAGRKERFLLWLAGSSAAILLERSTKSEEPSATPAEYFEHPLRGEEHVLLRKE